MFEFPLLAIETSCDETSAAVVEGRRIFSNVVSSQVDLHAKWGGIVPESAARAHVEALLPVIEQALSDAQRSLPEIRGIAVTNRPGLVGALSVGVSAAKGLGRSLGVPLVGVHHVEGHLLSPVAQLNDEITPELPDGHLCLIVSGGHTELVEVTSPGSYRLRAETVDDAAGEAFDKSARLLGLGYPGGRALEMAAHGGDPDRYPLPVGLPQDPQRWSFSGLKTAVLRLTEREGDRLSLADAAASIQEAIVRALVAKVEMAFDEFDAAALTLAGGVAANGRLRAALSDLCQRLGVPFIPADPSLCTDNAGMIGLVGAYRFGWGESDDFRLDVEASASLPGLISS